QFPSQMATFSSGATPSWINPLATRSMSPASWRKETRWPSKVSASRSAQRAAARSGRSPSSARSDATGHIDGHPGDEIRVLRGEEADHARLIPRLRYPAERRVGDLLRLLLGRPAVPVGPDPLGQGEAGGDGVDVHAEGAELVAQLAREGDDAPLGRRVG